MSGSKVLIQRSWLKGLAQTEIKHRELMAHDGREVTSGGLGRMCMSQMSTSSAKHIDVLPTTRDAGASTNKFMRRGALREPLIRSRGPLVPPTEIQPPVFAGLTDERNRNIWPDEESPTVTG
jgi:hypothetical protein